MFIAKKVNYTGLKLMLLNDAKISDFFRITNVFSQIYEKKTQ
jgi:hypothetical protein